MMARLNRKKQKNKGMALLWTLVLIMFAMAMIASMATLIVDNIHMSINATTSEQAYSAARAGIEVARKFIDTKKNVNATGYCSNGPTEEGTISENITFKINIVEIAGTTDCVIESTGYDKNLKIARKLRLTLSEEPPFGNNLFVFDPESQSPIVNHLIGAGLAGTGFYSYDTYNDDFPANYGPTKYKITTFADGPPKHATSIVGVTGGSQGKDFDMWFDMEAPQMHDPNDNPGLEKIEMFGIAYKDPSANELQRTCGDARNQYCLFLVGARMIGPEWAAGSTPKPDANHKIEFYYFSGATTTTATTTALTPVKFGEITGTTYRDFDSPPHQLSNMRYKISYKKGYFSISVYDRGESGECFAAAGEQTSPALEYFPNFSYNRIAAMGGSTLSHDPHGLIFDNATGIRESFAKITSLYIKTK